MSRRFESYLIAGVLFALACADRSQPSEIQTSQGSGGTTVQPTGGTGTGLVAGDGSVTGGTDPGIGGTGGDFGGTAGDIGGTDMGGMGVVIGGAPGETELLYGLAPEREAGLCLEIQTYLNTPEVLDLQHEMDCRSAGFYATAGSAPGTDQAAQAACQVIYEGCLASAMPTTIGDCVNASPACTATVGDLLACWHTTPAQLTLALEGIPSCLVLTLADLQTTVRPSPPPSAECQSFDAKCPKSAMLPAP